MPPDFNPDREGHHKHKFIVQKAFTHDIEGAVQTSKGALKPNDQGRMTINDEGLAREIQQSNPRELVVSRMNADSPADRGHRYHFGGWPEMPWKRKHQEGDTLESQKAQDESPAEVQTKEEQNA